MTIFGPNSDAGYLVGNMDIFEIFLIREDGESNCWTVRSNREESDELPIIVYLFFWFLGVLKQSHVRQVALNFSSWAMTLNFWSSCSRLPNARITQVYDISFFFQFVNLNGNKSRYCTGVKLFRKGANLVLDMWTATLREGAGGAARSFLCSDA